MNLAGTRGKKTVTDSGVSYELQDGHRVLEGMKMTPKYMQTGKYEFLAKLSNFGPFTFFFTLSSADMRWMTNFAPLLIDEGYKLDFSFSTDENGIWRTNIKCKRNDEEWKDICEVIENLSDSKHELIRGNVVSSTRYLDHRVKQFLSKIVLNKQNPMCVEFYHFKVEFQQRGAGKISLFLSLTIPFGI